jgi:hypothetical protein
VVDELPAAITHYFHSQRVLEQLKNEDGFSFIHPDAFSWGAQGPDFLYCHRYFPWQRGDILREYARKLHSETPSRTLCAMRNFYNEQNQNPLILSYIYGFLCHYSLDRTAHPFVNYGTGILVEQYPEQDEDSTHNEIESVLDGILLRYEKGMLPVDFDLKRTVPKNTEVQSQIAVLYADILSRLFGHSNGYDALLQATKDCRFIFGLLNDRTSLKKLIIQRLEGRNGKHSVSCYFRAISEGDKYDYANILHADWQWPLNSGKRRNEGFLELYEQAIDESMNLIKGFLKSKDISELTNDISFI